MDSQAQRIYGRTKGDLEAVDLCQNPPTSTPVKDDLGETDLEKEEQSTRSASEPDVDAERVRGFGGWESETDVGNPRNWSLAKKIYHTAIPAFYGFVV